MKKVIKILALGLAAATVFAGCNGGGNSGNSSNGGNNSAVGSDPSKYTVQAKGSIYADGILLPELSEKQAKITYMTNTTWDYIKNESTDASPTAIYHAMLIWKEVYGVDVEIDLVDWDSFTNHLISSVASGEGPDVLRYTSHPVWVNNNLLATLDDKMNLSEEGFNTKKMEEMSLNGHIYAVYSNMRNVPSQYIVYNKTKFIQAGEKTPMEYYKAGNWTFSQLTKSAKKLTSAATDDYGFTGTGLYPSVVSLQKDGSLVSLLEDSAFRKYFGSIANLYSSGYARTDDNQGTNYRETFPKGKDAMLVASTAIEYPTLVESAKKNGISDELGIAPMPVFDEIGETNPRGKNYQMDGFAMSLHSTNPEGAVEFLRLVTLVGSNISEKLGDFGQLAGYMTDEEKEVFGNIEYQDVSEYYHNGQSISKQNISGLETCYNKYIMQAFYSENKKTVSQIISEMSGPLKSVITEYEISIGLSK